MELEFLDWQNPTSAPPQLSIPLPPSPSSSQPPTPRAAEEEPVCDTNPDIDDLVEHQQQPSRPFDTPKSWSLEMHSSELPPATSSWETVGDPEPDYAAMATYEKELRNAPLYRHPPPLDPPRQLHKRRLAKVPKPCQSTHLPPWVAMRSAAGPVKRTKALRSQSTDAGAQLRHLRGAYLGYHAKEQAKIPLMASSLDVAAVNQQCENRIGDKLDQLVTLNRELHHHMDSFWRKKRTWSRRGGRRQKPAAVKSAVGEFDVPRIAAPGDVRNMYRANAKLAPPAASCCDTTCASAMFVCEPYSMHIADEIGSTARKEEERQQELDIELEKLPVDLSQVEQMSPSQLRLKMHNISSEMQGLLKQAKAMGPTD